MSWRVGRKVGRTLYRHQTGGKGNLIGLMDTPELASLVVAAVNERRELLWVLWNCVGANRDMEASRRAMLKPHAKRLEKDYGPMAKRKAGK